MPVPASGNGPYLVKETSWGAMEPLAGRVGLRGTVGWSRVPGQRQPIDLFRVVSPSSLLLLLVSFLKIRVRHLAGLTLSWQRGRRENVIAFVMGGHCAFVCFLLKTPGCGSPVVRVIAQAQTLLYLGARRGLRVGSKSSGVKSGAWGGPKGRYCRFF